MEISRQNKGALNIVIANTSIQDYQGGFLYRKVVFLCREFVEESLPRDGILVRIIVDIFEWPESIKKHI